MRSYPNTKIFIWVWLRPTFRSWQIAPSMALSAALRIYAPLTLELWHTDPAMKV
ncbi:hypothetical protein GQ588_03905 [Dehalobacter restrictus]|uniref:Uncharacterized protein n=1 Tax=Dehalobacter restrictus TaxID=55583 RepID=A0A857DGL3_9FIRM|nr:hypothetical protein GQ588_03905 [Dehalobacter restrictus]